MDTFIHLDIEPEPDCVLENTDESLAFFEQWLFPVGAPLLAACTRRQRGRSAAAPSGSHHALLRLLPLRGGVRESGDGARAATGRGDSHRTRATELGAARAVSCRRPEAAAVAGRLRPFADTTYLHQVVEQQTAGCGATRTSTSRSKQGGRVAGRMADSLSCPALHARVRRVRVDAGLRAGASSAWRCRHHSRPTSRSRPTPGTCCRQGSSWTSRRVDRPRVRVGAADDRRHRPLRLSSH